MTINLKWTPEEDARLFEYAAMGLSAGDAARLLGRRRNQAIGRAHRIGVKFRFYANLRMQKLAAGEPVSKPRRKSRAKLDPAPPAEPTDPIFEKAEIAFTRLFGSRRERTEQAFFEGGVAIWDLETHHCRWGDGDPRDTETFRYCGATAATGNSWCSEHRKKLTIPGSAQNAKRPAVSPRRVALIA